MNISLKSVLQASLGLLLGLSLSAASMAQDGPPKGHHGDHSQRLQQKLNLTDEQVSQLKPIFEAQKEKFQAQRQQFETKLLSILTPEQTTTYNEMKAEWQQRKSERQAKDSQPQGEQGAQDGQRRGRQDGNRMHGKGPRALFARLNLTDDQKAQLKAYHEANRDQMKAEREQFNEQVMSVLTPEQQSQWQSMHQKHRKPQKDS